MCINLIRGQSGPRDHLPKDSIAYGHSASYQDLETWALGEALPTLHGVNHAVKIRAPASGSSHSDAILGNQWWWRLCYGWRDAIGHTCGANRRPGQNKPKGAPLLIIAGG